MPSIQSTLQYNIKKKISQIKSRPTSSHYEKENAEKVRVEPSKSPLKSSLESRGEDSSKKCFVTEEKSNSIMLGGKPRARCESTVNFEVGKSDVGVSENRPNSEPLFLLSCRSTLSKSGRCTKRLFPEKIEDKNKEQCPSPPKQGRQSSVLPMSPAQRTSSVLVRASNATETAGLTYQHVRQALHSTIPEQMPGREKQLIELHSFLQCQLNSHMPATLYVSGPPGTGKTACLSKTMLNQEFQDGYKMVYVNCTSMKSAVSIYGRITEELNLKAFGKTAKDYRAAIEKFLCTHKKMILLVLDEIDQLDSRNQSVLYTIFEWPSKKDSKLVLVGIANALDLTDRILPRLQVRLELKPKLMHFPPYSKEQIIGILSDRLKEADASHILTPVAVQLVAAKVASMSGDARRALDIARRVVEQAGGNSLPLKPTTDHSLNTSSPKKTSVCSLDLKEVLSVLNSAYGASQTLDDECNESFPLQQKVLLCTLVLIVTKGKSKDVTAAKLYSVYRKVCLKRKLPAVCQAELLSLCGLVATRGVIRVLPAKEPRLAKICLQWDEQEVEAVLKDKQLLDAILRDTSCLGQ